MNSQSSNFDRDLQVLRLIDGGTRMRLCELGNRIVSRRAKSLLSRGLIRYAPERWIAYECTQAGLRILADNPRDTPAGP